MHYLIVAGGTPNELPNDVIGLGPFDMVVCANGGVHNAMRLGLVPNIVVGDLDSLSTTERTRLEATQCRFLIHPAAKDETDLELALLWCAAQGATKITVIGAFGDRPDHTLANLLLLTHRRLRSIEVCLYSRRWRVWLVRHQITLTGRIGDTVSLIPITARVTGIETQGLEYPLHGQSLLRGPARGVSNVMTAPVASVRCRSGLLMVMHGPPQAEL